MPDRPDLRIRPASAPRSSWSRGHPGSVGLDGRPGVVTVVLVRRRYPGGDAGHRMVRSPGPERTNSGTHQRASASGSSGWDRTGGAYVQAHGLYGQTAWPCRQIVRTVGADVPSGGKIGQVGLLTKTWGGNLVRVAATGRDDPRSGPFMEHIRSRLDPIASPVPVSWPCRHRPSPVRLHRSPDVRERVGLP